MTGTGIAQVVGVAVAPLLTRLYDPVAYGYLGMFTAISGTLAVVATGRYELAVPLPLERETAVDTAVLSCMLAVGSAVFALLGVAVFGQTVAMQLDAPGIYPYLWLIPVTVLAVGIADTLSQWAVRERNFGPVSQSQVSQSVSSLGVQLGAGLLGFGAGGLIWGRIAGQLITSVHLASASRMLLQMVPAQWSLDRLKYVSRLYVDFPRYNAPKNLLNTGSKQGSILLLAFYFGPSVAGLYALCYRILKLPTDLLGNALKRAMTPRLAELSHTEPSSISRLLIKSTLALAAVGALPVTILLLGGPVIFATLFGSEWREAGVYAQILIVWLAADLINGPCIAAIPILGLQRVFLGWGIVLAAARIGAIIGGGIIGSPASALMMYSGVGLTYSVALTFYVIGRSRASDTTALRS